jgi:hypothetical protein
MIPPLARRVWPLIQAPSGPARKATASAICRYVYDWLSALHLVPNDWNDISAQLTFRFALDAIAKEGRWYGDDFLFGCHAIGECKEFPMSELGPRVEIKKGKG